jgi:tripartite-type tricarboxylate transporter receptor subunit TctC
VDLAGRLIAEGLRERLGQPVIVENRPGAGGNIGVAAAAKSAPDGYTLCATAVNSLAINSFIYDKLPFDPERDLFPVSLGWEAPLVLVVPAAHVAARTVQDFVAWTKRQKGGVSYGSSGIGTTVHLSGALLCRRLGIDGTHVPFRGGSEALTALLRGDTQFAVDNLPTVLAAVRDGALRALAVTSAARWPDLPEVPTMTEAGLTDFVVTSWGAVSVPAGTPRPTVERLSEALRAAAVDPALQARFAPTGNRPLGTTPEEAAARAAKERPMWREAVRISGARLD